MKKTGFISVEQRTAEIRPLPKKYYDPKRTMSFLSQAKRFYANRTKRYEVQLEVILTVPYSVTARTAKEASNIIRGYWEDNDIIFTREDISCVAITTFRNGNVERDVVL